MDYFVAERIKSDYIDEIAKDEGFHSLDSLGHTKEEVITAYKVSYIHMVKYQTHAPEYFDQEMLILMALNSFFDHEDYTKWNTIAEKEQLEPQELRELMKKQSETLFASDIHYHVSQFVESIQKLDRNDPLYFQRAYTIAGLEYKPEYKISMERAERYYYSMEGLDNARKLINQKAAASSDISAVSTPEKHQQQKQDSSNETNNKMRIFSKNKFENIKMAFYIVFILTVITLYLLYK